MRRAHRRALIQGLAIACLAAVTFPAGAGDVSVPVRLQTTLIGKVAAFDRAFHARSGKTARVVIVHKSGDSERVAKQIASAFDQTSEIAGLPISVELFPWNGAAALASSVRARPTALVYLSMGLEGDAPAIAAALAGASVLTVGATGAMAERGACVGFELEEGKPRIYVNLRAAKAQNVDFVAGLLRLVKLV